MTTRRYLEWQFTDNTFAGTLCSPDYEELVSIAQQNDVAPMEYEDWVAQYSDDVFTKFRGRVRIWEVSKVELDLSALDVGLAQE